MPEINLDRKFSGLNKTKPPTNLRPNEAVEAKNVFFTDEKIEKRRGSMRISPYAIPKASLQVQPTSWAETAVIPNGYYTGLGFRHGTQHTLEACYMIPDGNTTTVMSLAHRSLQETTGNFGWGLLFKESTREFYYKEVLSAGTSILFTGTYTAYAPNKSFHIAVVRDGAECRMYLTDGVYSGKIGSQTGLTVSAVETATVGTYAVTWGSGYNPDDSTVPHPGYFRVQDFRTWAAARTTNSILEYALKELPSHAVTGSIRFYHKFNEGTGQRAYDYGTGKNYSTMSNYFAAVRMPSGPEWIDGLQYGGFGDKAVRFDGKDDVFGVPPVSDYYSCFRTGTSDWTVQAVIRPLEQIQDGAAFLHYGGSEFKTDTTGFAFQIRASVDPTTRVKGFKARACFTYQTAEITFSTNFTCSSTYYLTLQKKRDELGLYISDPNDSTFAGWSTVALNSPATAVQFSDHIPLCAGCAYNSVTVFPTTGYAHFDLDELRLFSSARFDDLDSGLANLEDTTIEGYWRFNDGSGGVVEDISPNLNQGYLLPISSGAGWRGGFVEPVAGPTVYGVFDYQKNINVVSSNDTRSRGAIICAGSTYYRQEGSRWYEIGGSVQGTNVFTADQLNNFLPICNGEDDNALYDGTRMWANGLSSPKNAGTATVVTTAPAFFDTQTTGGALADVVMGQHGLTCADQSRTESGYTLNGKRVDINIGGSTGTIQLRVDKYFKANTFTVSIITNAAKDSCTIFCYDFTTLGLYNIPTYGLELADLQVYTVVGGTQTLKISSDHEVDTKNGMRSVFLHTDYTGDIFQPGYLYLRGHFIWQAASTETIFSTCTYQITPVDGVLTGDYYYRHTNYNRYTKIESNPSPPSDSVVSPNQQYVLYTVSTETDTNCTDRLVYRTLDRGARDGEYYYLLGTLTGTAMATHYDLTPSGQEGRLISFYRDPPPKSSIVKVFKGRAWYVPVSNPNLVYFSAVDQPGEVDFYNYLRFGDDKDYITGLGAMADNLIVFKRRSIWAVSRSEVVAGMRSYCITDRVGCVAHNTIREVNGEILFLADDGLYGLSGSSIRKISHSKTQYYFDRTDPRRRHLACAGVLERDGIYRLAITPHSTYATTERSGVNSWVLDYHYDLSADRTGSREPFFDPVFSFVDREVSCFGEYVTEDNERYTAYGDYRGFAYIDNVPENYTEGLGWYRSGQVTTTKYDWSAGTLGSYTITVSGVLPTSGHGLKGLRCYICGSAGTESVTVYKNTASSIVFTTPLTLNHTGLTYVLLAPIHSYYRSGWQDMGSSMRAKAVMSMKLDHRYETSGTMTTYVRYGRSGWDGCLQTSTHSFALNQITERLECRGRGKHVQVAFEHYWPGEKFEIYNWQLQVNATNPKGAE